MRFELEADEIDFPTPDDIHFIHDTLALGAENPKTHIHPHYVDAVIGRATSAIAYDDPSPDLIRLAAYLWHGISEAHAYADGNKRTGLLTALAFLAANGVAYDAPSLDIGRFVLTLYKRQSFKLMYLESYLRRFCRWAC